MHCTSLVLDVQVLRWMICKLSKFWLVTVNNKIYILCIFQMNTSEISCYYCCHSSHQYQNIIDHLVVHHNNCHLKIKQYSLCPSSGKLEYATKTFPIKPIDLSQHEKILFNSTLKVQENYYYYC